MALGFYFDMSACIGCKTCQMACKDKNNLEVGRVFRCVSSFECGSYPNPSAFYLSQTCNHCENPACTAACPVGAMYKDEETGVVLHDEEMCIGCGACAAACPYGAPKMNAATGKSSKCDSCIALRQAGGQPECVASCVMRAIEFGDMDELKAKHPEAISVADLPFMPEICAMTGPNTIVTVREGALGESVMKNI